MKLYNYWRSSSSWRVRIALAHKAIAYQYVAVNLLPGQSEQNGSPFDDVNPLHQVPVLEIDREVVREGRLGREFEGPGIHPSPSSGSPRRIAQSIAIIEYLEERFPAPPLLPGDPWCRSRARQLAEMINSGVQPFQNVSVQGYVKEVLGGKGSAFARHFVTRGLRALERTAAETAGQFLVGDQVSLADVYLVPQMYAARRLDVDLAGLDTLLRVERACESLLAFQASHPDRQPDAVPPSSKRTA
jgi:maleylpyruvate isomerase